MTQLSFFDTPEAALEYAKQELLHSLEAEVAELDEGDLAYDQMTKKLADLKRVLPRLEIGEPVEYRHEFVLRFDVVSDSDNPRDVEQKDMLSAITALLKTLTDPAGPLKLTEYVGGAYKTEPVE